MHDALTESQRGFDRLGHTRTFGAGRAKAVLHHLQGAAVARMDARVALTFQPTLDFGIAEIVRHGDRRRDDQARVARVGCAGIDLPRDVVRRLFMHRLAAAAAVQRGGAREQQLQVIVQFGHRADRRTRGAHLIALVDGDGRRHAGDRIDLRRIHAVEELPCVRREGFDIAPLAFGIQRVEYQRGLAGTGHAGHHGQQAEREIDVDVLQVVLPHATQADGVVRREADGSIAWVRHGQAVWR